MSFCRPVESFESYVSVLSRLAGGVSRSGCERGGCDQVPMLVALRMLIANSDSCLEERVRNLYKRVRRGQDSLTFPSRRFEKSRTWLRSGVASTFLVSSKLGLRFLQEMEGFWEVQAEDFDCGGGRRVLRELFGVAVNADGRSARVLRICLTSFVMPSLSLASSLDHLTSYTSPFKADTYPD
jgi:hypothetical protein